VKNKGKILAVDFGWQYVGLAVTDADRTVVFGKGVIKDYGSLAKLFVKIAEFCAKEQIVQVVMGVPTAEDGKNTEQSEKMINIGKKLEAALKDIPVSFEDESFTSYEADRFLRSIKVKNSEKKDTEDEIAAILILKRYLAKNGYSV
jgi:putative transcription antitermination factor YqgF